MARDTRVRLGCVGGDGLSTERQFEFINSHRLRLDVLSDNLAGAAMFAKYHRSKLPKVV
jgi:hypothetical protein